MKDTALNASEHRLVAAVNAAEVLDLSARPDPEKTLRASIIREILLGRYIDQADGGRIRIRGANIEGDLDLTSVQTDVTLELEDCRLTQILVDSATIPRLALDLGGRRASIKWVDTLGALRKILANNTVLITVSLFVFVVIKVIYVAHGDIETALGILNTAGPTTVIVGALLSVFPLVSALVLGLVLFELSSGPSFIGHPPFVRRDYALVCTIGAAAAVACLFLTPWPIMASSAAVGLASGLVLRLAPFLFERIGDLWLKSMLTYVGRALLALCFLIFILNPVMYSVWLPHELLTFAGGTSSEAGYVLSDSDGWVSQLRSGQRRIYRYLSADVVSRTLCRGGQSLPSTPWVPAYLTSPDSLWKTINPSPTKKLPKCF
jgi:hypothetical protein